MTDTLSDFPRTLRLTQVHDGRHRAAELGPAVVVGKLGLDQSWHGSEVIGNDRHSERLSTDSPFNPGPRRPPPGRRARPCRRRWETGAGSVLARLRGYRQ